MNNFLRLGIIWQGKKFSTDISPKGAFSNNSLKYVNTVEFGLLSNRQYAVIKLTLIEG